MAKRFIDTRIYPVFFMMIVTIIFVGILATLYSLTQKRITKYAEAKLKETILLSFDYSIENYQKLYDEKIVEHRKKDFIYYEAVENGASSGYCFPLIGKGLWGSINGMLSVTPDFEKIINLEIVSQNETPGLGGRISEEWFKEQFTGKVIFSDNNIVSWKLTGEENNSSELEVNQVTGATASSKAVVNMILEDMKEIQQRYFAGGTDD